MSSNLRVNNILPSVGTNVAIGTAGGSITLTGSVTGSSITNTGVTTVAAGSASAPSISPTGDSNTGIFFPSADTIAFAEGGAEAARFDSSGRLGIGTVLPNTKLHIAEDGDTTLTIQSITGSGQSPSIRLQRGTYGTDGFNDLRIYNVTGALLVDNIDSAGAATNLLYANPTGVGIGSTIPENKLDVNGTIKSYSGANKATFKDNQLRSDASGTFYFDHGTASQSFTFRTSTSTSLDTTGPSITSAGNISFPSGKGIDFSANANAAGMTSELLDDYERGTFTPSFTGSVSNPTITYLNQLGRYVKIGNVCFVEIRMVTSNVAGGSGNLQISGLPFSQSPSSNLGGAFTKGFVYQWAQDPETFITFGGDSNIYIYRNDSTNTLAQVSDLTSGAANNYLNISGSYITT